MSVSWRNQNTIAQFLVTKNASTPETAIKATDIHKATGIERSNCYKTLRLTEGFIRVYDTDGQLMYWYDYPNYASHCKPDEYYPRINVGSPNSAKVVYINKPVEKIVNANFSNKEPDIKLPEEIDAKPDGMASVEYIKIEAKHLSKAKEKWANLMANPTEENLNQIALEAVGFAMAIRDEKELA